MLQRAIHICAAIVSSKFFDFVKSELFRGVVVGYLACILDFHAFTIASKANDAEMAATR